MDHKVPTVFITIISLTARLLVVFALRPHLSYENGTSITDADMTISSACQVYCNESVVVFFTTPTNQITAEVKVLAIVNHETLNRTELYWNSKHPEKSVGFNYFVRQKCVPDPKSIDQKKLLQLYEQGNANRVYVYVEDSSNVRVGLIAQNDSGYHLATGIGQQLTVPCRPANKLVTVKMRSILNLMNLNTSFSHTDGFSVYIANTMQGGKYECDFAYNQRNETHEFYIHVNPEVGSVTQIMTCNDRTEKNVKYRWLSKLSQNFDYDPAVDQNILCFINETLIVLDASHPTTSGTHGYDCRTIDLSLDEIYNSSKMIQTFETCNSYIDAMLKATNTTFIISSSDPIKANISWSVTIDESSCIDLGFTWIAPGGLSIEKNTDQYTLRKRSVSSTVSTHQLIVNQPTIDVTGTYTLRIHSNHAFCPNPSQITPYTFRLLLEQQPNIQLKHSLGPLLVPNIIPPTIMCTVTSWPPSVVEWSLFECPPPDASNERWPIVEQCQKQPDAHDYVDFQNNPHNEMQQDSRLEWSPQRSGFVQCTAQYVNRNLSVQFTENITFYVEPVQSMHELREQRLGDAMHMSCLVYNESVQMLQWQHNDRPVQQTVNGSVMIREVMVGPYIKSTLSISATTANNMGRYACMVEQQNAKKIVYRCDVGPMADSWLWTGVGAAIGGLTFLVFLGVIIYVKGQRSGMTKTGVATFFDGDMNNYDANAPSYEQAHKLPYDKSFEFPSKRLFISDCQLGAGAFGVVYRALAQGIVATSAETTVAVKMAKGGCNDDAIRNLITELKIMTKIGKHENVLQLLGAVTRRIRRRQLYVITEFCKLGNLQQFLRSNREDFMDQLNETADRIVLNESRRSLRHGLAKSTVITTIDLMFWAMQAARGMLHLISYGVLHGDLAARNCLLNGDRVLKIADFGLSRALHPNEDYQKTSNDVLPLKWMAIESLRDRRFSTSSDVWSFGVLLWEIFSLADAPYAGVPNERILERLLAGHRMLRPRFGTHELHELMRECWHEKTENRPDFASIVQRLGTMLPAEVWLQCSCLAEEYERPHEQMFAVENNYCDSNNILMTPLKKAPMVPPPLQVEV